MLYLACDIIGTPDFINLVDRIEHLRQEQSPLVIDPELLLTLSTFYYLQGKPEDSFFFIDKGISMYRDNDDFKIEKCKILILQKKYNEAIDTLNTLDNTNNPKALYERLKLSMLMHHERDAKFYTYKILNKISNHKSVYTELTFFFAVNHMLKEAQECWTVASRNPSSSLAFKMTHIALKYELGEYSEAFEECQKIYNKYPNHLIIGLYLAYLSFSLKKHRKATNLVKELKKIYPYNQRLLQLDLELTKSS